jgi:hypothetical protein
MKSWPIWKHKKIVDIPTVSTRLRNVVATHFGSHFTLEDMSNLMQTSEGREDLLSAPNAGSKTLLEAMALAGGELEPDTKSALRAEKNRCFAFHYLKKQMTLRQISDITGFSTNAIRNRIDYHVKRDPYFSGLYTGDVGPDLASLRAGAVYYGPPPVTELSHHRRTDEVRRDDGPGAAG